MQKYIVKESLTTGNKSVNETDIGGRLYRIIESLPGKTATLTQVLQVLKKREEENGDYLTIKSIRYNSADRSKFVQEYLAWLVRNRNLNVV